MVNLRSVIETLCYMVDEDSDGVEEVMQLPSIDLIRCGECKHRISGMCYRELGGDEDLYKRAILFPTMPDDFCSYGEREGE